MQVQIKFTKSGANAAFGGFSPGDKARVSKSLADHFVNDAGVAVYCEKAETKVAEAPVLVTAKKSKQK